jgi:uncharacterized DUF497 family protein
MEEQIVFEWDEAKAQTNFAKHGLAFQEAIRVFSDEGRLDEDASQAGQGEERRKTVGLVRGRLVTVVYTLRAEAVRIISARRANGKEESKYRHVHTGPK